MLLDRLIGMQPVATRVRLALVASVVGTLAWPPRLDGQAPGHATAVSEARARADSVAVADAVHRFLTAFENLDWARFRASFSEAATVFHPSPDMAERVTGPRGIDSTFRAVFADIRARATGGPPYHRLVPTDLRIQPLSPGFLLVTFHLHNTERLGRRTIIFRHEDTRWRILHLHASNTATKP